MCVRLPAPLLRHSLNTHSHPTDTHTHTHILSLSTLHSLTCPLIPPPNPNPNPHRIEAGLKAVLVGVFFASARSSGSSPLQSWRTLLSENRTACYSVGAAFFAVVGSVILLRETMVGVRGRARRTHHRHPPGGGRSDLCDLSDDQHLSDDQQQQQPQPQHHAADAALKSFTQYQAQLTTLNVTATWYIIAGAFLFAAIERRWSPDEAPWLYDDAVYFCIVSLTTVGKYQF